MVQRMKGIALTLISLLLLGLVPVSVRAADWIMVGDIGCKPAAVTNVRNIASTKKPFIGLGDYEYKCRDTDMHALFNSVNIMGGSAGNHECEKGQGTSFGASTFHYGSCQTGYTTRVLGDVAFIGINPYAPYKKGSVQYNFIDRVSAKYRINHIGWLIYYLHPNLESVKCSGDHCHAGDTTVLNTLAPLQTRYHAIFITAHTHVTAYGKTAICGGGGEDGTELEGTGNFKYASNKMGYCLFHSEDNQLRVLHIGTDGKSLHIHSWSKS